MLVISSVAMVVTFQRKVTWYNNAKYFIIGLWKTIALPYLYILE